MIYDGEVNNTKKKKINIIDDIYFYNKETFRFIEINKHAIDTYDKIKKEIFNNEKDNFLLKKLINIINVLDYKLLFKIENSTKYIIFEKTISEKNVEKRFIAALNIDLDSSENIKTYIKKHNFTTLFDLFLDEYIENEAILWCNEQKIPYIIE